MKNPGFYFLAAAIASVCLASCAGDGGCSMKGEWKVKSADLTSEKLDSTIMLMAKEVTLARTYSFTADSVVIRSGGGPESELKGTYEVDDVNQALNMDAISPVGVKYVESMKIINCGGGEVTVVQRTPADTTLQALSKATLVLERARK